MFWSTEEIEELRGTAVFGKSPSPFLTPPSPTSTQTKLEEKMLSEITTKNSSPQSIPAKICSHLTSYRPITVWRDTISMGVRSFHGAFRLKGGRARMKGRPIQVFRVSGIRVGIWKSMNRAIQNLRITKS